MKQLNSPCSPKYWCGSNRVCLHAYRQQGVDFLDAADESDQSDQVIGKYQIFPPTIMEYYVPWTAFSAGGMPRVSLYTADVSHRVI